MFSGLPKSQPRWVTPNPQAQGPMRLESKPYVPSQKWVRETLPSHPTSKLASNEQAVQGHVMPRSVMSWSMGSEQDPLASPLDRFLAAQELGLQHELDILIFRDVPSDQLVSLVCAVRAPYKSVSINSEYERSFKPHHQPSRSGYLILYHAQRFEISRWPEFHCPSLFYASDSYLRPPLNVVFRALDGQAQPLSLYVWQVEPHERADLAMQLQLLLDHLPERRAHEAILLSLGLEQEPVTHHAQELLQGWTQSAGTASWSIGVELSSRELPGVQALSPQGHGGPFVFELREL